jgi:hypothetical protein
MGHLRLLRSSRSHRNFLRKKEKSEEECPRKKEYEPSNLHLEGGASLLGLPLTSNDARIVNFSRREEFLGFRMERMLNGR